MPKMYLTVTNDSLEHPYAPPFATRSEAARCGRRMGGDFKLVRVSI